MPALRTTRLPVFALWLGLMPCAGRAESTPVDAHLDTATSRSELQATAARLEQDIARLEAEYGGYDPRVGEQLLSQGRTYQQLNQHKQAIESLERAFQIKRVNDGLYSLSHAPILLSVIASEMAIENWDAADQHYDHLLWIYQRNYEEGDQALLSMYDQVGRWKIRAYSEDLLDASPYATISAASRLYAKTIELTEARYGKTDPRLIELHYGLALANYHSAIEFAQRPLDDYVNRGGGQSVRYVTQCRTVPGPGGRPITQCFTIPVPDYSSYARAQMEKDQDVRMRSQAVRRSLEQVKAIFEAHPELPSTRRAVALVHLGDWHFMNRAENTALEHYRQAEGLLRAAPDGEALAKKIFGEPVTLPALRIAPGRKDDAPTETPAQTLTLGYDVTKAGKARNVHFVGASASDNAAFKRKAITNLRAHRFRPRIENGVAVDTVGITKPIRVPAK